MANGRLLFQALYLQYNILICTSRKLLLVLKMYIFAVREPEFIIHPTDAYAAAPFSVMFTCTAKGFGHLSIEWHRGGSLVLSNQSEQIVYFTEHTNSYIKSTIIIYNVTDDDAGEYYCTASNELKESNSTAANLYFSGKPLYQHVIIII